MKKIIYLLVSLSSFSLSAQDSTNTVQLNEVVVSGNKIEENKRNVAQQINIISAKEIKNLNAQTTADLLIQSGTVFVQKSQQGGGSPVIRGFESSRVQLVVDGVRMNNLIFRGGHLQNVITLDQSILDRVEVVQGPASTIFGSDALGGVIHFVTKAPKFSDFSTNAYLRYATGNQEKTAHFDINLGNETFASLTSVTLSDFGDLRMGESINPSYGKEFGKRNFYVATINGIDELVKNPDPYIQKFSGYSQIDLLQKFSFKASDNEIHDLNFQYSNSSNIPRYDRLTDPLNTQGGLKSAEWYYGPQKRLMLAYNMNLKEIAGGKLHFGLSYQDIEESRNNRNFGRKVLNSRVENVNVLGINLDWYFSNEIHDVRIGFDAQFNSLKSTATKLDIVTGVIDRLDTRYPNGTNEMNTGAFYVSHTARIGSKIVMTEGFRATSIGLKAVFQDKSFFPFPFNDISQNNISASGNCAVIYSPTEKWKISILGSTGFRAPNVDDLSKVFESVKGSLIVPNPELKPEKTLNLDISVSKTFGNWLKWENTYFVTSFQDAIVTDKFTFNGQDKILYDGVLSQVLANQNKRKATITGFSSLLKADFTKNLSASASYNVVSGKINETTGDTPLDHIPPTYGRLAVQYRNAKFSGDFFVVFNGKKKIEDYLQGAEDNETYAPTKDDGTPFGTPAWSTLNLRTNYSFSRKLTLQVGIDNILDLQYRYFASGINASGRSFIFSLRSSF